MRPLPLATNDVSCFIAEKSEVNEAGVNVTDEGEEVLDPVVVGVVPEAGFDELLHADAAIRAPAVMTIAAARFPLPCTRGARPTLPDFANNGCFTAFSSRYSADAAHRAYPARHRSIRQ